MPIERSPSWPFLGLMLGMTAWLGTADQGVASGYGSLELDRIHAVSDCNRQTALSRSITTGIHTSKLFWSSC